MKPKTLSLSLSLPLLSGASHLVSAHEGHAAGSVGLHSMEHALWLALPVLLVSLAVIVACRYLEDRNR